MIDEPWNKDNEEVLRVLGSRVSAKINVNSLFYSKK
jgi:hypothetical protein